MEAHISTFNNDLNEIKKHFNLSKKDVINFFDNLSTYSKCENNYIQSIKSLCDSIQDYKILEEISDQFTFFKTYLMNICTLHERFINSIKVELIDTMKNFVDCQTKDTLKLLSEYDSIEKTFRDSLSTLNKVKSSYICSAKNTEKALYDLEMSKNDFNLKNKENFEKIANNSILDTKEKEKIYIETVDKMNILYNTYNEKRLNSINKYKRIENSYFAFIRDLIKQFYTITMNLHKELFHTAKYGIELMDMVQTSKETTRDKLYKSLNYISRKFPTQIEFEPYSLYSLSRNGKVRDMKVRLGVIRAMKKEFKDVAKDFDESKEEKSETVSNLIKISIYHGECISNEEKKNLIDFIKEERNYRKKFLSTLNIQRSDGRFEMNQKSISLIGEIMWEILNEIEKENDYELLKFLMILAQTFYFKVKNDDIKYYLQTEIIKHSAFEKKEFWIGFIDFSVNQGIKEMPQPVNEIGINNIHFSQLVALLNNMFEFRLDKEMIYELLTYAQSKFNVIDKTISDLKKMVKDKVYEQLLVPMKNRKAFGSMNMLQVENICRENLKEKYRLGYRIENYIDVGEEKEEIDNVFNNYD